MLLRDSVFPGTPTGAHAPRLGHVVVTRYAMRVYRDRAGLTDRGEYVAWLKHRLTVFEQVCLPSVTGQKKRPDRWLLGLDHAHADDLEDLVDLVAPYPWIEPVWQHAEDDGDDLGWRLPFQRRLADLADRWDAVATTRVDNDDALALTYISDVHRYSTAVFNATPDASDFWIAFTSGAQLVDQHLYSYIHHSPHFLTRVRRTPLPDDPLADVMGVEHANVSKDPNRTVYRPLTSQPMWLENVHERNVSNADRALLVEFDRSVLALFGLETPSPEMVGRRR